MRKHLMSFLDIAATSIITETTGKYEVHTFEVLRLEADRLAITFKAPLMWQAEWFGHELVDRVVNEAKVHVICYLLVLPGGHCGLLLKKDSEPDTV